MKTLLVAIDAKYIHMNLAVRLMRANAKRPVEVLEATIKDDPEVLLERILASKASLVGFSVYIWNIGLVRWLTRSMKRSADVSILWGGPEVSYDAKNLLETEPVDFILREEGEEAFPLLLEALSTGSSLADVPNLVYREAGRIRQNPVRRIADLGVLESPYLSETDPEAFRTRVVYVETSRGCPYRCSYCLASLEKSVRFFPLETVKANLRYLLDRGVRTIKFLDRTFNANPKRARELFQFLIDNAREGVVFQFEITGDVFPESLAEFVNAHAPKHRFRFEIGIQSLNEKSNLAVDRIQDNEALFRLIRTLTDGDVVDLHLDLIAGLPYETLADFIVTFDGVFRLYAKEMQLGFLKMLKGTKIRKEAEIYHYRFDTDAPYEIRENAFLSAEDLGAIHLVEEMLERYWNKGLMNEAIRTIMASESSPFLFFHALGQFHLEQGYEEHRYQLTDLFARLEAFLALTRPGILTPLLPILRKAYLAHHPIKPKIYWRESPSFQKKQVLCTFAEQHPDLDPEQIRKYGLVTEFEDHYLIVLYLPEGRSFHFLLKEPM